MSALLFSMSRTRKKKQKKFLPFLPGPSRATCCVFPPFLPAPVSSLIVVILINIATTLVSCSQCFPLLSISVCLHSPFSTHPEKNFSFFVCFVNSRK